MEDARALAPALPARLTRDVRLRAVVIWIGLRAFLSIGAAATGAGVVGGTLWVGVPLLVAAAFLLDLRVSRESMLLSNLGLSRARLALVALAPALALETALQIVLFWTAAQ